MLIFKNLPDTTTPINAENLNNNFSGLEEAKIIKSYRVSTQESGNQWKKIGVATFGGSDTYKIVGTSQVSNLNGRGHFELLISGESQNNASASLVYATNGITSDMFKVYASTDYKTIKVYFNSPQWTAYRMQVYLIRVYDGGVDSFESFDTKETPAGDVEIEIKQECVKKGWKTLYSGDASATGTFNFATNAEKFQNLYFEVTSSNTAQRIFHLLPSYSLLPSTAIWIDSKELNIGVRIRINNENFEILGIDGDVHIRNVYGLN